MSLIAAILLWIGAIVSPSEVNETTILNNQAAIDYYEKDPGFVDAFQTANPTIVITEINEGD